MRILITNWTLIGRHGSVMWIRDVAAELMRRGVVCTVYAPNLGEVADELKALTIPVIDSLDSMAVGPDVVLGNSNPDMIAALLHFPMAAGVFVCHAWDVWPAPFLFPRLRHYVAVDETCRDWMLSQHGIDENRVHVVLNSVDLELFVRRPRLPEQPARALVFSNYATEITGINVIREACQAEGITLDVVGQAVGALSSEPERLLLSYDVVFAKARCALEAMAVGNAVVVCDYAKLGPLVTEENWQAGRRLNFGRRAISRPLELAGVRAELERYSASDAGRVCDRTRRDSSLVSMVDELLDVLRLAVNEQRTCATLGSLATPEAELRAAGVALMANDFIIAAMDLQTRFLVQKGQLTLAQAERDAAVHERDAAVHERDAAVHERDAAVHERDVVMRGGLGRRFRRLSR